MKARKVVSVQMYIGRRPSVSDSGAMKRGPIARPRVYKVKGRTAASRDTEKACCMRGLAGTVIDEAKVLRRCCQYAY